MCPTNIHQLSVLDLGCLEGGIAIKLTSRHEILGTDVRGHIRKCEFASTQLNLNDNCSWLIGDVTDDSFWQSLGSLLKHAPDCYTISQ